MASICVSINVFNDNLALPGCLENAASWADDIFVIHAGPGGKHSNDGTIETLEKWGVRTVFADILEGFGVIRTRLVHECGCDFCWISDADERFYANTAVLHCHGTDQFPHQMNPQNTVSVHDPCYAQGKMLRSVIEMAGDENYDAVRTCRRAWMDFSMKRPAQSWHQVPDWQLRCLRNKPYIGYDPNVKIHESVKDFRTGGEPKQFKSDDTSRGLYHDHFSIFFKWLEPAQNTEDAEIYDQLEAGASERMWLHHFPKS